MFEVAKQILKVNSKTKLELYKFIDNVLKWKKVQNKFDHIEKPELY